MPAPDTNQPLTTSPLLHGVDFTSAPRSSKGITIASGMLDGDTFRLQGLLTLSDFTSFVAWLDRPGPWLCGFDFPFSLPRELVTLLGWPSDWPSLIRHYASLTRAELRDTFKAVCDSRPAGSKFLHRAADLVANSSSSMKWVNPPVAYMLHAAVPLLRAAGVSLPGLHPGDPQRVALEAYPGLLARELIDRRSYKSDDGAKQTPERLIARKDLITALETGRSRLGLRLKLTNAQRDALAADGSGDRLDAVLCLVQAAWAERKGPPTWGLPAQVDPLEGWIVTV